MHWDPSPVHFAELSAFFPQTVGCCGTDSRSILSCRVNLLKSIRSTSVSTWILSICRWSFLEWTELAIAALTAAAIADICEERLGHRTHDIGSLDSSCLCLPLTFFPSSLGFLSFIKIYVTVACDRNCSPHSCDFSYSYTHLDLIRSSCWDRCSRLG